MGVGLGLGLVQLAYVDVELVCVRAEARDGPVGSLEPLGTLRPLALATCSIGQRLGHPLLLRGFMVLSG